MHHRRRLGPSTVVETVILKERVRIIRRVRAVIRLGVRLRLLVVKTQFSKKRGLPIQRGLHF